ncbi:MAG: hypothetical protein ACLRMZ_26385 [Blautia marasmi]
MAHITESEEIMKGKQNECKNKRLLRKYDGIALECIYPVLCSD